MQYIKKFSTIGIILVLAAATLGLVSSHKVYAEDAVSGSKSSACQGASLGGTDVCSTDTAGGLSSLVATVINILSIIVGVAAIIMVIIGGFRYVLSTGDSANTNSAKNTIIYALVGLAIAALAQVLVHFVLNRVESCPTGQTGTPGNCVAAPQSLTKIGKPS